MESEGEHNAESSQSLVQPLFLVDDKREDPWRLSLDIDFTFKDAISLNVASR